MTSTDRKKEKRAAKRAKKNEGKPLIECAICGTTARCLTSHLKSAHGLTATAYRDAHPGSPIFAPDLLEGFRAAGRESGHRNEWNAIVRLWTTLEDAPRKKMISALEKAAGRTLEDVYAEVASDAAEK